MGTTFTKTNTFDVKQTQGDTFDTTITVTSPATWAGYSSGECNVKDSSGNILFALTVDISTNGQLRLYKTGTVDNPVGTYYYAIKWTMTDGSIKTWVKSDNSLHIFEITGK